MYHIRCSKKDIAQRVLVCGDPGRTMRISKLMERVKLVNEHRGLLVYTGLYNGERITAATTGMGAPSAAIVLEELAMLGAKAVIRVGTTGGIREDVHLGDLVVPTEAIPLDGATKAYMREGGVPKADADIVDALRKRLEKEGVRHLVGPVCTSDTFYLEEEKDAKKWSFKGVLSFEMECSVIFAIGSLRGYRAGAVLAVTGGIYGKRDRILDDKTTARSIENGIVCALDVISAIRIEKRRGYAGALKK
jgi:DeoD family purine-nucleoside phosphorylase